MIPDAQARIVDHAQHHVANLAVIALPLGSFWLNAPVILSVITGILGAIYYVLLIEKMLRERSQGDHNGDVQGNSSANDRSS